MRIAHVCRYDVVTFGLVSSLAKRPGVVDVKVLQRPAASSVAVTMWERAHQLVLPQDYKDFLAVSNGRWRMSHMQRRTVSSSPVDCSVGLSLEVLGERVPLQNKSGNLFSCLGPKLGVRGRVRTGGNGLPCSLADSSAGHPPH
jgi:hypothetical protein